MTEGERHLELSEIIDELSSFIDSAPDRIRSYYSDDYTSPDSFPELKTSPAQIMVEDAADLVEYEFSLWEQRDAIIIDGDWAYRRSYYIHISVAFELLFDAHFMRKNPLEYADRLENEETPNVEEGKQYFLGQVDGEMCKSGGLILQSRLRGGLKTKSY